MDKSIYSHVEGKLYNFKSMKVELNSYKIDLEYLDKEYQGCKGKMYTSSTSKTNSLYSSVENELLKKEKQKEMLEFKIKQKEFEIKKIENALNLLDDEEMALVKFRYFSNTVKPPSWSLVALRVGYTELTCRNMRDRIIKKLYSII